MMALEPLVVYYVTLIKFMHKSEPIQVCRTAVAVEKFVTHLLLHSDLKLTCLAS
jgi:hypothetical protein